MIAGRKPVAFLAVAPAIREHEVVAQVQQIPSPRDEVIDVGCRWRKRCAIVEASAPLGIDQNGAYDGQRLSLATEIVSILASRGFHGEVDGATPANGTLSRTEEITDGSQKTARPELPTS
jgi:hypothetical protein